jgi:hypothetical protein
MCMAGCDHAPAFCSRSKAFFVSLGLNNVAFVAGTPDIGEVVDMGGRISIGVAIGSGGRHRCTCGCRYREILRVQT